MFEPRTVVLKIDEFSEMEIRPKIGVSCRRLHQTKILEDRTKIYAPQTSSRQLIPLFDKPAFSRFSQLFQPRIVVHLLGKIVKRQVCQKGG
jgi:hypothetical protein